MNDLQEFKFSFMNKTMSNRKYLLQKKSKNNCSKSF